MEYLLRYWFTWMNTKVTDLKSADVLADDYARTLKKSDFSHKPYPVKSH